MSAWHHYQSVIAGLPHSLSTDHPFALSQVYLVVERKEVANEWSHLASFSSRLRVAHTQCRSGTDMASDNVAVVQYSSPAWTETVHCSISTDTFLVGRSADSLPILSTVDEVAPSGISLTDYIGHGPFFSFLLCWITFVSSWQRAQPDSLWVTYSHCPAGCIVRGSRCTPLAGVDSAVQLCEETVAHCVGPHPYGGFRRFNQCFSSARIKSGLLNSFTGGSHLTFTRNYIH